MERRNTFRPAIVVAMLLALLQSVANAQSCGGDKPLGHVVSLQGSASISNIPIGPLEFQNVSSSSLSDRIVCPGATIKVDDDSRLGIYLTEINSVLRLDAGSEFVINAPPPTKKTGHSKTCTDVIKDTWMSLKSGILHIFTTQPQELNISTPYMNASVEGTEFVVSAQPSESAVSVLQGLVSVCNDFADKQLLLKEGEGASAGPNEPPRRFTVDPENAVQWAIFYPPIGDEEATNQLGEEAYKLLNSGRVAEAQDKLITANEDAYTLALRSIIALAKNDVTSNASGSEEYAASLADRALDRDSNSTAALIAKSYVLQAEFDIDGAIKALIGVKRKDEYVLTRLAELELSTDDRKQAEIYANEAVSINSSYAHSHSVLGFVNLSNLKFQEAGVNFRRGIAEDEKDPLPRLGLGLLEYRLGNSTKGEELLEIAVSLDPVNSLLRS